MLPYFQQIPFDSAFVTQQEYYEFMLIVQSQGIPIDTLKQFSKAEGGLGSTENKHENISNGIILHPNYPNTFNCVTNINFFLMKRSHVELSIYNITGQKIATILSADQLPGYPSLSWDATNLNSGIYCSYLLSENYLATQKFMVLK